MFNATVAPTQPPVSVSVIALCEMLHLKHQDQSTIGYIPVPDSDPFKQVRIFAENTQSASLKASGSVVRLHDVLKRTVDQTTNWRLGLDRKQRFGVATALTWAVLHLCESPWLEETLRDEDIYFFIEQEIGKPLPRLSNHLYLSHSFQLPISKSVPPAHAVTQTQTSTFQSKQIQNIALYSLAIRLIELGLNKPFDKIRSEYQVATSSEPSAQPNNPLDDFDVAKYQISELYLDPGMSYGNAVDRCLRFLFPGPPQHNTFQFSSFRSTFFADVVAPIQATFELIPWSASQIV
jgi:hypothetical protein